MYAITYEDNTKEVIKNNLDLDVPSVNRKKVTSFFLIEHRNKIGVDASKGLFYFNGLEVPFEFHSPTTEFVLFRRMRAEVNVITHEQGIAHLHRICFGLRNTLPLPDGTTKCHIQLIWIDKDGKVTIGGNK